MSWKDKFPWAQPKPEMSKVEGVEIAFYPISVGMAFKAKAIAGPLAKAITVLFAKNENDFGTVNRRLSATTEIGEGHEIICEPIAPALAEMRSKQRLDAIDTLVKALSDDTNLGILGDIIMDSLRDQFPKSQPGNPPGVEFIKETPLTSLGDLLIGTFRANKRLFGPLAETMDSLAAQAKASIEARVSPPAPETDGPISLTK